jgi:hypothetical protein
LLTQIKFKKTNLVPLVDELHQPAVDVGKIPLKVIDVGAL